MIKLLAKSYSQSVGYLCDKFDMEQVKYDLVVSRTKATVSKVIIESTSGEADALIMVGNVGDNCSDFAETLGLDMFYDKFVENTVTQYCKYTKTETPPQYVLDKLCLAPEAFNHLAATYGYQCACYGEYNKKHVFFIPDDARECAVLYDGYLCKNLFKGVQSCDKYVFKIYGLSQRDVESRLEKINRNVSRKCETLNLDTRLVLTFAPKTSKGLISDTLAAVKELFRNEIYSANDQSLAKTLVDILKDVGQMISTAESMTGGMIASSIVDVAGASSVLYEGVVTYSIQSKCKRLGINPHFVDEYGVVSQQVAQAMAVGLRKNGSNIALSITGNAGPTAEDDLPVGLCYIGVATERGVSVYKNRFLGDRNSIRAQATNMALFLAIKTLTK